MNTGTIKTLTPKGFGFITRDGQAAGEKDLFFHSKELKGVMYEELREGDKVSFEIDTTGPKGAAAVNVSRA